MLPRLVIVSSSAVYGGRTRGRAIHEKSRLRPASLYGIAKLVQEWLGVHAARAGLPVIRVRLFNVIGPGQPAWRVPAGFAEQIVAIERGRRRAVVTTRNLEAARDFTDVRDAVRALRVIAEKGRSGEVYNVCSGRPTRVGDLLHALVRQAGMASRLQIVSKEDRDVVWQRGSCRKLRRLGWRPKITLAESVKSILEDWRQRRSQ